jgi:hypothetical protein
MIKINGRTVDISGSVQSLSINNGQIRINGRNIELEDGKVFNIEITGDVQNIDVDDCESVTVNGNVTGSVKTISGDIRCGNIGESVKTISGDVRASEIKGSVSTVSGDVSK